MARKPALLDSSCGAEVTHRIGDFFCCLQASEKAAANIVAASLVVTTDYVLAAFFDAAFVGLPIGAALQRRDIALRLWEMSLDVEVIGSVPTPVYRCNDLDIWSLFIVFTFNGGQDCDPPCFIKEF